MIAAHGLARRTVARPALPAAIRPGALLLAILLASAPMAFGAKCLTKIGVWTIPGEEQTPRQWDETARYLTEKIPSCEFTLVPLRIDALIEKVQRNHLDFVIAGPAVCVELEAKAGAQIIAAVETRYRGNNFALGGGTLFCLNNRGDLRRPSDLKGKLVATVHERSLEDWLSTMREFKAAGLDPQKDLSGVLYLGSPDEVVMAVLSGRVDAGSVRAGTLERMSGERNVDLNRVLILSFESAAPARAAKKIPLAVSTRLYPHWCFSACPKASPEMVKLVSSALLAMQITPSSEERGPRMVGWTSTPSVLPVHECLQELRMPPYERFGEIPIADVIRQYMYWFIVVGAWIIVMSMILWYSTSLNRALTSEVAERRKAEASLAESVQRFEHVASSSAEWIWEADLDGRYTYSNAMVQRLLGYAPQEVIGKRFLDILTIAERERLASLGQVPLKSGARTTSERYRLRTKDGRVVIHESTAAPIITAKGNHIGFRGVNRDITSHVRFVQLRP